MLRLHGQGVSIRRIATDVFGTARFRGRVERIVAGESIHRPAAVHASLGERGEEMLARAQRGEVGVPEMVGLLVEAWLSRYVESGAAPPPAALSRAMDVYRQLETVAAVERLKKLQRRD